MNSLPSTIVTSNHIDVAIVVWLDAKRRHSGSERTESLYKRVLYGFRSQLQEFGMDLDPRANVRGEMTDDALDQVYMMLSTAAQGYAAQSTKGQKISEGTYANRLAIISSFYNFAIQRRFFRCINPIKEIERPSIQPNKNAIPYSPDVIAQRLRAIDRTTLLGARDYAMLSIYMQTGRRLQEVVNLLWENVQIQGDTITLFFRCKGNKPMRDTLTPGVARSLLEWLHMRYGDLSNMQPDTPLWVSTKRQSKSGHLTTRSVSNICEKRLGFSKVHTTRHTWARTMEDLGAKVSEIQARLGHESLATTGRYLAALKQSENQYADKLASKFGLE